LIIHNLNYGYPKECNLCNGNETPDHPNVVLTVEPFEKEGNSFKLMLVGQDPTIFNNPGRVEKVLMLNEKNGQLAKWLKRLFGEKQFTEFSIYATNLVKCTFPKPPSVYKSKDFLKPYFDNCNTYLKAEIQNYKPNLLLSFGEPAHRMIITIFDNESLFNDKMQDAFTGQFFKAKINDFTFDYSPCLHIKTFRVAETYGNSVVKFKEELNRFLMK